jgi:Restriction endonuclease
MTGAAAPLFPFAQADDELCRLEIARLAAAMTPTPDALRLMSPPVLRATVALMLDRLGYELLTPETAADFVIIKDGKKYLVAFAPPNEVAPTPVSHITRLHAAVTAAGAAGGFFVTPRGFTRDAEAYAATAPLKLVDGLKLIASIERGIKLAGVTVPDTYKAMCRQCGDIVKHPIRGAAAIPCVNGHPVAPTIARAALVIRRPENGSTSRTYDPPHRYSRQEVRAHNAKYQARMRKRKTQPAPESEFAQTGPRHDDSF